MSMVPHAKCTGGRGMTPPEDCGGAYGYAQLRKILENPNHEEYEEHEMWAKYDFDLKRTNKDLSDIEFTSHLIEE